jgi:hypothetical protein
MWILPLIRIWAAVFRREFAPRVNLRQKNQWISARFCQTSAYGTRSLACEKSTLWGLTVRKYTQTSFHSITLEWHIIRKVLCSNSCFHFTRTIPQITSENRSFIGSLQSQAFDLDGRSLGWPGQHPRLPLAALGSPSRTACGIDNVISTFSIYIHAWTHTTSNSYERTRPELRLSTYLANFLGSF